MATVRLILSSALIVPVLATISTASPPLEHQLAAALNGLFEHPLSLNALNDARTALYAAGYTE